MIFIRTRNQSGDFQEDEDTNQVIFRRTKNQSGDFQKNEATNQVIFKRTDIPDGGWGGGGQCGNRDEEMG